MLLSANIGSLIDFLKEIIGVFSFKEVLTSFMVLFAIIDITGSIPIIVGLKESGHKVEPAKAALYSGILFLLFLFIGEPFLGIFGVTIESFAVAGAIILLILAGEMVLDVEIFKYKGPGNSATIVPIVFPLVAGAGGLTSVVSLSAEFARINIMIAVFLNMIIVFVVLKHLHLVEKILGQGGIYILRKFFGITLLAMSIKLFVTNIATFFTID